MTDHRIGAASWHRGPRAASGFTLTELIFAILVLAVLTTLAVPSFNDASLGSKLGAFSNDLLASTQIARSEAIKRNDAITLCASEDGATCGSSAGWEVGWIVLGDAGVIQHHEALPDGFIVSQAGGTASLTFPAAVVGATTATFKVCRDSPDGKQERVVTVTASGGASVATTETGSCP